MLSPFFFFSLNFIVEHDIVWYGISLWQPAQKSYWMWCNSNAEEPIKEDNIGSCLGCSNHALVELVISRNMGLAKSQVRTMNFRKVIFQLFKEIVDGVQMASEYIPGQRFYNTQTSAFKCLSVTKKRLLLSLLKSSKIRRVPDTSTVWVEKKLRAALCRQTWV